MHTSRNYEGVSNITMRTLPKIGYIVFNGKTPIAAGFLRRLEPCYAQIDTLVTNAYCGSILRHQALEMVVSTLINDAKRLKLEGIICHTNNKDVIKRAEELGFHFVQQYILALPLK